MGDWEKCPDDILINIFKNFDFRTRLQAVQVCQKWNQLLKDPSTIMEDVYQVQLKIPVERDNQILADRLALIGKTELLDLGGHAYSTIYRVKDIINDGRLRIDKFLVNLTGSTTNFRHLYLFPTLIRDLEMTGYGANIRFDWSRLPNLERLKSRTTLDPSTISLPSLKYLQILASDCQGLINFVNLVPTLEELSIYRASFHQTSFRNFLQTIQNRLPNLRRLYFDQERLIGDIDFRIFEQYHFPALKKIGFENGFYVDIVRKFIRSSELDQIHFGGKNTIDYLQEIYALTASIGKKNPNFELTLDLFGTNLKIPITLAAFDQMLTKLSLRGALSFKNLKRLIEGGSYDKLTDINFKLPINDDLLKIISQSYLVLEKLRIENSKMITETGLKSFLINWQERKSKKLSIECVESILIDGLFGTSIKQEKGILDEKLFEGKDNENGEPSAKKPKKSMENEKRWMIFQKSIGTRLVIWDQDDSDGSNQKILVIKDYDKERLNTFKKLMI